ncbi:MAG: thiamine-phosphate kinase [Pseudomonadota bacterium]
MAEFDLIERYFAPLAATSAAARGLADDTAFLASPPPGLVVTADACVEGVHFLKDDPPAAIAQKALRVNLSDLIAKGARPFAYLLTCAWPRTTDEAFVAAFASGLAEDQATYDIGLIGGDTTSTDGPLLVSVTALGEAAKAPPARAGAKPGDALWVSGDIGAAGLGLAVRLGELSLGPEADEELTRRYRWPEPPMALRRTIAEYATASIDVSDGLLADARHVAQASGVTLEMNLEATPLAPSVLQWVRAQADESAAVRRLAAMGDDYQTLFTAPEGCGDVLRREAQAAGVRLTRIGRVTLLQVTQVTALWRGVAISVDRFGFEHPAANVEALR